MKNFMEVPTYIDSLSMTKIIAPGYLDYRKMSTVNVSVPCTQIKKIKGSISYERNKSKGFKLQI